MFGGRSWWRPGGKKRDSQWTITLLRNCCMCKYETVLTNCCLLLQGLWKTDIFRVEMWFMPSSHRRKTWNRLLRDQSERLVKPAETTWFDATSCSRCVLTVLVMIQLMMILVTDRWILLYFKLNMFDLLPCFTKCPLKDLSIHYCVNKTSNCHQWCLVCSDHSRTEKHQISGKNLGWQYVSSVVFFQRQEVLICLHILILWIIEMMHSFLMLEVLINTLAFYNQGASTCPC